MRYAYLLMFLLVSTQAASLLVPAVTSRGQGITVRLECEVRPGQGRVLVSTEPLVGVDTQSSEKAAVAYVSKRYDLSGMDVLFIFESNATSSIDGGSAGAAMAICLISELSGRPPNYGVSITGTVDEDGNVGRIGGLLAKARAVSGSASVLLIPAGQSRILTYTKSFTSPKPGIYIEELRPVEINVSEYAHENLGLRVVEVSSIQDAEEFFFGSGNFTPSIRPLGLPDFPANLSRVQELADYELDRAKRFADANSSYVQNLLEQAINVPEGYPYTRANLAFLAYIAANPQYEDVDALARELYKRFKRSSDPYWHAEAEMRISWSLFKGDFSPAKKEWLAIVAKMLSMENQTGDPVKEDWVGELANERILSAKNAIELARLSGSLPEGASSSLELAIRSFEEGMYYAALYNAIDAEAWARAGQTSPIALRAMLLNSTPYSDGFSEAYRRHAFYLFREGNYEGAAFSLYRAELRRDLFSGAPRSSPGRSFDWRLFVIFLLASYILFNGRKPDLKKGLSGKELPHLMDARAAAVKVLQEKLEKGEIDASTYGRLLKELGG